MRVGRWFHNQFPPFFSVLHCPLGHGELQACPFPDVVFPPLPLSTFSSFPFHCALQDGFGQTWWTGDCPCHFSLRLFTMVRRSSCGPTACWILARTSHLRTLQSKQWYTLTDGERYRGKLHSFERLRACGTVTMGGRPRSSALNSPSLRAPWLVQPYQSSVTPLKESSLPFWV